MNLFLHEIKSNLKSLIFWSLGMSILIAASLSKFSVISKTEGGLDKSMESFPKVMRVIMGASDLDMNTFIGYFAIIYGYALLFACVHAAMLGASIISKEERDKTSEFLFSKPISRAKIVTFKTLSGLVNIFFLNIVSTCTGLILSPIFSEDVITKKIILFGVSMLLTQIIFFTLGLALSGLITNSRKASSIASSAIFVTYLLSIFIDIVEKIDFLNILTPFKYFIPSKIIEIGLSPFFIAITLFFSLVFLVITYTKYSKRDLKV